MASSSSVGGPACTSAETSEEAMRRFKFYAQRKFAQGMSSPSITSEEMAKTNDSSTATNSKAAPLSAEEVPEATHVLPVKRPNTEDFLTFLCFRRTSILPPSLDFFNTACTYETDSPSINDDKTSNHSTSRNPSISNCPTKQGPVAMTKKSLKSEKQSAKNTIERRKLAQKVKVKHLKTANVNIRLKKWMLKKDKKLKELKKSNAQQSKSKKKSNEAIQNKENAKANNWKQKKNQILVKQITKTKKGVHFNSSTKKKSLSLRKGLRSSGSLSSILENSAIKGKPLLMLRRNRSKIIKAEEKILHKKKCMRKDDISADSPPSKKSRLKETQPENTAVENAKVSSSHVSSRPSRKTKEAAALFMEMLGKEFRCPNQSKKKKDDDTMSVESFPELPSAKENEQIEKEIKEQAKKVLLTSKKPLKKISTSPSQKKKNGNLRSQKVETRSKTLHRNTLSVAKKKNLAIMKKQSKPLGSKNKGMVRTLSLRTKVISKAKKAGKKPAKSGLRQRTASLDDIVSDACKLEQNKSTSKPFKPLLTWHETFLKSVAETVKGGRRSTSRMSESADSVGAKQVHGSSEFRVEKQINEKTIEKTSKIFSKAKTPVGEEEKAVSTENKEKLKSSAQEAKKAKNISKVKETSQDSNDRSQLLVPDMKKVSEASKSKTKSKVEEKVSKTEIILNEPRKIGTRRSADSHTKGLKNCHITSKSVNLSVQSDKKKPVMNNPPTKSNDAAEKSKFVTRTQKIKDLKAEVALKPNEALKPVTRNHPLIISATTRATRLSNSATKLDDIHAGSVNPVKSKKSTDEIVKKRELRNSVDSDGPMKCKVVADKTHCSVNNQKSLPSTETSKLKENSVAGKKPISSITNKSNISALGQKSSTYSTVGKKPISKILEALESSEDPPVRKSKEENEESESSEKPFFRDPNNPANENTFQRPVKAPNKLIRKKVLKSKVCLKNKSLKKKLLENGIASAKNEANVLHGITSEPIAVVKSSRKNSKKKGTPKKRLSGIPNAALNQDTPKSVEICTLKSYDDLFNEMAANFSSCLPENPIPSLPNDKFPVDVDVDLDENVKGFEGKKLFSFDPILDYKLLASNINKENESKISVVTESNVLPQNSDKDFLHLSISSMKDKDCKKKIGISCSSGCDILEINANQTNAMKKDDNRENLKQDLTENKKLKIDVKNSREKCIIERGGVQDPVLNLNVFNQNESDDCNESNSTKDVSLKKDFSAAPNTSTTVTILHKSDLLDSNAVPKLKCNKNPAHLNDLKIQNLKNENELRDGTKEKISTFRFQSKTESKLNDQESAKENSVIKSQEISQSPTLNISLRSKKSLVKSGDHVLESGSTKKSTNSVFCNNDIAQSKSNNEPVSSLVPSTKRSTNIVGKFQKQSSSDSHVNMDEKCVEMNLNFSSGDSSTIINTSTSNKIEKSVNVSKGQPNESICDNKMQNSSTSKIFSKERNSNIAGKTLTRSLSSASSLLKMNSETISSKSTSEIISTEDNKKTGARVEKQSMNLKSSLSKVGAGGSENSSIPTASLKANNTTVIEKGLKTSADVSKEQLNQCVKVCVVDVLKGKGRISQAELKSVINQPIKKPGVTPEYPPSENLVIKKQASSNNSRTSEKCWKRLPEAVISIPKIAMDKNAWIAKHTVNPPTCKESEMNSDCLHLNEAIRNSSKPTRKSAKEPGSKVLLPSETINSSNCMANGDSTVFKPETETDKIYEFDNEVSIPKESYKDFVRTVKKSDGKKISDNMPPSEAESIIKNVEVPSSRAGSHLIIPVCVQKVLSKPTYRELKRPSHTLPAKEKEKKTRTDFSSKNQVYCDQESNHITTEGDGSLSSPVDFPASAKEKFSSAINDKRAEDKLNIKSIINTNQKKLILNVPKLPFNLKNVNMKCPPNAIHSAQNNDKPKTIQNINETSDIASSSFKIMTDRNHFSSLKSSTQSSENSNPIKNTDESTAVKIKSYKNDNPEIIHPNLKNRNTKGVLLAKRPFQSTVDESILNPGSPKSDALAKPAGELSQAMKGERKDITKSQMNALVSERTRKLIIESAVWNKKNKGKSFSAEKQTSEKESITNQELISSSKKDRAPSEFHSNAIKPGSLNSSKNESVIPKPQSSDIVKFKTLSSLSCISSGEPELPFPVTDESQSIKRNGSLSTSSRDSLEKSKVGQQTTAVQVKMEEEAVIECSSQTNLDDEGESGGQVFYIPLQQPSSDSSAIQGVAVKLDTEGPNKRVIMRAKLVTQPPSEFSVQTEAVSSVMPLQAVAPEKRKVRPLGASSVDKSAPVGTVLPTSRNVVTDENVEGVDQGTMSLADGKTDEHVITRSNKKLEPFSVQTLKTKCPTPTNTSSKKPTSAKSHSLKKEAEQNSSESASAKMKLSAKAVNDTKKKMERKMSTSSSSSSSSISSKSAKRLKEKNEVNSACGGKILEAPCFYPSEEELQDPLKYIESIMPQAEKFGICRIVPPSNFKPDCKVSDDMRFTANTQHIHRMMNRWGASSKELSAIRKQLAAENIPLKSPPCIGGIELDLPALYQKVQQLGGLATVVQCDYWHKVAEALKIPKSLHDRSTKLYDIYCKYLLPYDNLSEDERRKLFIAVEKEWKHHKFGENDFFDDLDKCILKGQTMALSQFYRIAKNLMALYFGGASVENESGPDPKDVEKAYWELVSAGKSHVNVYAASIDSGPQGFGFPTSSSKNCAFSKHPCNLKVLTHNIRSVLRSLGPITDLTIPTLHVGMLFSTLCWFRDPHGLPWIEYLHTGASKIWYGIPAESNSNFRRTLSRLLPSNKRSDQPVWLPSDSIMIPPNILLENGVSVCRTVQQPGQFVVVFPRSFTSSISTGYLLSESVFFALPSWLNFASEVFEDLKRSCEPSVFSFERLLHCIVTDTRSSVDLLIQVSPLVNEMRDREVALRAQLDCLGLHTSDRLKFSGTTEDTYECEICCSNLFISHVFNTQNEEVYCLSHAAELLLKKKQLLKHLKLFYRHSEQEMDELVKKLLARIEEKNVKKLSKK
ncbi:unnamed protein product [Bemisia tabaci]|uniref:Uncharacterized protein n=1 Tax=Bemisia tabaci TaxID=7038 RepID=A0A9P0F2S7_BEMTA|nr:unnamed protein product [Bemisia tabaci]